jgi:hypothetical protein
MSRRIFLDIEEALAREVRRITFHDDRTRSKTVLQDTFDPITGEVIQTPVQADFYDSAADANNIQYPNVTIKLLKSKEDLTSGRVVPEYGRYITTPVATAPRAYEVVISGSDGQINPAGNDITTSIFTIRKAQVGQLIRVISGNNIGTYKIASIVVNNSSPHVITVSPDLLDLLPAVVFDTNSRTITFTSAVDLNTIKVGDDFVDSLSVSYPITSIDIPNSKIVIGGMGTPSLLANSKVNRPGNVFQTADLSLVRYMVLDPTKPVFAVVGNGCSPLDATEGGTGVSPAVPIDAYYLIRIDSKERQSHIDIINRIWEEFNPPRTGLPTIVRNATSFEQLLTADVASGGSSTINVGDNSGFFLNDPVFIFDELTPSKDLSTEGFEQPLSLKVLDKIGTTQLVLSNIVPDTFKVSNGARIVSNADFSIHMFNFVDHVTKDIDGSQYWVHELTFLVQFWIDRLGNSKSYNGVIRDIATPIEDLQNNVILQDT